VAERSFGLGPLEPLLRDPAVDEVMVTGTRPVWVERGGRVEETAPAFASVGELRHAIERDPRAAGAARRRGLAALRRAAARLGPGHMMVLD
jgi:pilus assembly protein CpaF